jgi:hypothetical protein
MGPLALQWFLGGSPSATFVGHYPWFFSRTISCRKGLPQTGYLELGRRAILGFSASAISDTCSNSIRVVKVYKQESSDQLSYPAVRMVVKEDSYWSLSVDWKPRFSWFAGYSL